MHVGFVSAIRDYAFLEHHHTTERSSNKNKNQMGWKIKHPFNKLDV